MSSIGVSYFGNRIPRHVAEDMEDLARRGFTGVLHTFSENDLQYYRGTLQRMVELSHSAGLEVQIDPWGLGRAFGGEAESIFLTRHPEAGQVLDSGRRVGAGCLNHPLFRDFVRSWADAAIETGADLVFWDEPHWAFPKSFGLSEDRWACVCGHCQERYRSWFGEPLPARLTPEVRQFRDRSIVDFLADLVGHVASGGGRSTVCLLPVGEEGAADWEEVAALEGLDTFATDPYWKAFGRPVEPFVVETSARVRELANRHDIGAQIWIQGFGLGGEDSEDIRAAVHAARRAGIDDLWTWGYEACAHMSYFDAPDPEQAWETLVDALTADSVAGP